ncbi:MAG TPA: DnaA/Hda family protein, partial [bacterium]|nr:DnaA/Hda family protein [bacterium]
MPQPAVDPSPLLWQQALARLEREVGDSLYQTVFKLGHFKGIKDNAVIIAFPYQYLIRLFSTQEIATFDRVFTELLGRPMRTSLVVEASPEAQFSRFAGQKRAEIQQRKEQLLGEARPSAPESPRAPRPPGVIEAYSFGEFVVRDSNQLAFAAARAVAESPGSVYNPLYLYSGTGLGKTHLLHAIANEVWRRKPGARVAVLSAEDYANELIEAIRNRTTKEFRDKYHSLDLLLIDDLHFMINKPSCQEAFFHTFNTFFEARKQIVITSDRKPRDLTSFQDRLISRLEGGLLADMQRPAYETRLAILQRKAEGMHLEVPVESLSTVANLVTTNVRGLEGCLKMLKAQ